MDEILHDSDFTLWMLQFLLGQSRKSYNKKNENQNGQNQKEN